VGRTVRDQHGRRVGRIADMRARPDGDAWTVTHYFLAPVGLRQRLSRRGLRFWRARLTGQQSGVKRIPWKTLDLSDPTSPRLIGRPERWTYNAAVTEPWRGCLEVGKGETGMINETRSSTSDEENLRALTADISNSRDELGVLVEELDRRRHRLFDLKAQIKRHAVEISLTAAALAVISAAVIWLAIERARRRASLVSPASHLRTAERRIVATPQLAATGPTMTRKLFAAVATAALGSATRTVVANVVQDMIGAGRHVASSSPRRHGPTRQLQRDGWGRDHGSHRDTDGVSHRAR
jgi:hypothetical protein